LLSKNIEIKILLLFSAEYFVFQFAIQKYRN